MREEKENKLYVAIIGDLIGSKKIDNRQAAQEKLLDALSDVNLKFKDSLYAGFIVTTGDEFQALAMDLKSAYELTIEIKHRIHPYPIRFGVGCGSLNVFPENRDFAIGFDGKAFWRAREAIQESEKSGVSVVFRTGSEIDDILKSIQTGIDWISKNRTNFQKEVIRLNFSGMKQKDIAHRLKSQQPNISRALKEGGFSETTDLKNAIFSLLDSPYVNILI
ncbi:MAG: SatD family protein [bacterium]